MEEVLDRMLNVGEKIENKLRGQSFFYFFLIYLSNFYTRERGFTQCS